MRDPKKQWINAVAPIRICDIGGWTDTWFAVHRVVFHVAVYPYVEVQIQITEKIGDREKVIINVENYGDRYTFIPSNRQSKPEFGKHPLIEAALNEIGFPEERGLDINIYSEAPSGASTGTSAAVSVALIGALGGACGQKADRP